jgi:glycerol-3-phosphate dehydrogenase
MEYHGEFNPPSMGHYPETLPARVRVLVLGGGIHGVGVLHDLASRGWRDIHLVEKSFLGAGTSSKSTKLVHGGLRYLKRLGDFSLVAEALRERRTLMTVAPDLVKPIELVFPIMKRGGMPRFMVKAGLSLYDRLAGKYRIEPHRLLSHSEMAIKVPPLNTDLVSTAYSFWDAQTDDLGLVQRAAASARSLGAGISEGCQALRITPNDDGFVVDVKQSDGTIHKISALYVINCLGPWANRLLEASGIPPTHRGVNNKGSHLLFDDMGLKAGMFLQSMDDDRIFFMLPWQGYTLLGTTEELFQGDPDGATISSDEVGYLLHHANRFLRQPLGEKDVRHVFSGLRWLAVESGHTLTETSRAYVIGERAGRRGFVMTLYGGKLTTYRNLAETIGNRITQHFGEYRDTRTQHADSWLQAKAAPHATAIADRFRDRRGTG